MDRLRAILVNPLTDQTFAEIAAIYDNVAYIYLYLEANKAHVNYDSIRHWRNAYYSDEELNELLRDSLTRFECESPLLEESRQAYLTFLNAHKPQESAEASTSSKLLDEAIHSVTSAQEDKRKLLNRLGIEDSQGNPDTTFYRLLSGTDNPETREKLANAMQLTRDKRLDEITRTIDQMISNRMREARANGFKSALDSTMSRCAISEQSAEDLIHGYLTRAVREQGELNAEVGEALGDQNTPMAHFGYFVRQIQSDHQIPLFDLAACLQFAFEVARRTLGVTIEFVDVTNPHVMTASVTRAAYPEHIIGHISFDLWQTDAQHKTANHTLGMRNRTDWGGVVKKPVAYVSCRFRRDAEGREKITFQNVHSLFHEIGHALNHVLIEQRLPTTSGLDYLPLERLENLSMWFEKWIYHQEFDEYLAASGISSEGLTLCRRIKSLEYRRTHIDRAVTAALDFRIHRHGCGIQQSFAELDEEYGISTVCSLGELLPSFTQPMLQANPGGYFAYLWGAAYSAEMYTPYHGHPLADINTECDAEMKFRECLDTKAESTVPAINAVFDFYNHTSRARSEEKRNS